MQSCHAVINVGLQMQGYLRTRTWCRILICAALVVAATGCDSIGQRPQPDPRLDAERVLIVDGWTKDEARQIMVDFANLYVDDTRDLAELSVDENHKKSFTLAFPKSLNFSTFLYLVNYFHYPHRFDLSDRNITVLGIVTLDETVPIPDQGEGFCYVPNNDTEFDVVFVHTSNGRTYRAAFKSEYLVEVDSDRQSKEIAEMISNYE